MSNPQFGTSAPALFTQTGTGQGQVAALNQDNTVNGPSNPAARGSVMQLFGTGQNDSGCPGRRNSFDRSCGDSREAAVYLGGADFVKDEDVLYSGLAPGLVEVWQVNAKVPQDAAPGQNDCFILYQTQSSVQLPNGSRLKTVVSIKYQTGGLTALAVSPVRLC